MGFLNKNKAPSELPDLAVEGRHSNEPIYRKEEVPKAIASPEVNRSAHPIETPSKQNMGGEALNHMPMPGDIPKKVEVAGEDYLEFKEEQAEAPTRHEEVRKQLKDGMFGISEGDERSGFFDNFIEDINGEIKDLGKLEDWYNNKFLPQDVVSNMRTYWEGNKEDILIQSFGKEYKEKINAKIKILQELEMDWREIYFKLVKKEEEMKKEERVLKETLSEFVDLCKRRKLDGEKNEKSKD